VTPDEEVTPDHVTAEGVAQERLDSAGRFHARDRSEILVELG